MNSFLNNNFIKDYDNQHFLHPWEDCRIENSEYKVVTNSDGIYLFDENLLLCGFAAVIGHIYPIFYKFKGGKGVATYVGVYIAFSTLNPYSYGLFENSYFLYLNIPLLAFFYFVIFKIFRISAIASLLTVFISNLILFSSLNVFQDRLIVFLIFWLIVFKHSENLKRLYEGKENKF